MGWVVKKGDREWFVGVEPRGIVTGGFTEARLFDTEAEANRASAFCSEAVDGDWQAVERLASGGS